MKKDQKVMKRMVHQTRKELELLKFLAFLPRSQQIQ